MTTVLLIRHAVNDWVKTGKLAGWTPGVHLNEDGQAQARALGERLAKLPLRAIYASPLERTMETAQAVAAHFDRLSVQALPGVGEVQFGAWQGQKIATLARRKMWRVIQMVPSRAYFPDGETMRAAQMRAVDAVESVVQAHPRDMVAVVSHSDVIKLVLAHYLGLHIDLFQRLAVSPASVSVIELGFGRPTIVQINDTSHNPNPQQDPPDGKMGPH
ncbi:MAG: MSMEG_4193 family putative phosphomutase [Anaerolineae bacterium]|nr:MSMEG_4193 family putative phosphomutase [Anaerolineae bacterium]